MGTALERELRWSQLLQKAQKADQAAYTLFLRELAAYLQNFLKVKFREPSVCEDLIQEILLAVHKARHTYQPDRPLLPWIHAVVRFKSSDFLRKIYKDRRLDFIEETSDFPETFFETAANEELDDALAEALQKLPEKQRRIVSLLKIEGLSIKEAAAKMSMSEAALKVSAHRAYKAMRKSLSGGDDEA